MTQKSESVAALPAENRPSAASKIVESKRACVVDFTSPVIQLVKIYHETRAARVELSEAETKVSE